MIYEGGLALNADLVEEGVSYADHPFRERCGGALTRAAFRERFTGAERDALVDMTGSTGRLIDGLIEVRALLIRRRAGSAARGTGRDLDSLVSVCPWRLPNADGAVCVLQHGPEPGPRCGHCARHLGAGYHLDRIDMRLRRMAETSNGLVTLDRWRRRSPTHIRGLAGA